MFKKIIANFMEWLFRLAYLNILWILFSLPVVTIIPSTFAMFAVIRKWEKEDLDLPIFQTFWQKYRLFFWKSYQLGLFYLLAGLFLYIDFLFIQVYEEGFFLTFKYAFIIVIIFYFITSFYSIPIYLNYQFSWYKTLFIALMLGVRQPIVTIITVFGVLLVLLCFVYLTGIGILFLGSLSAFFISKAAYCGLEKL
jgi:uncharacterized membrane protein YesL